MVETAAQSLIIAAVIAALAVTVVAPPFGLATLLVLGLMALTTRRTVEVVEEVKAEHGRAAAAPGCLIGVLVLVGLGVGFIALISEMGL